jgi:hypothetical protein
MFMTPSEIKAMAEPHYEDRLGADPYNEREYTRRRESGEGVEETDELWERKRRESVNMGLDEHIAKHGVRNPVPITWDDEGGAMLAGGHHRVAAAGEDTLIPVVHHEREDHDSIVRQDSKVGNGGRDKNGYPINYRKED